MTVFVREPLRRWLQRLEEMIGQAGSGNVGGPVSSTVNAIATWANLSGTALKNTLVTITSGGSIVVPVGQTVDGRDVSVDGAALDDHLADTANPHAVTKTQVGLANVTNDAQLKRTGADWSGFSAKATPVSADLVLIEDSADSGNKKKVQVSDLVGSGASLYKESSFVASSGANTTTSTSYVDVPSVTLTQTLVSGDILLISLVACVRDPTHTVSLQLVVDGVAVASSASNPADEWTTLNIVWRATGLSAGARTVKAQWKVDTGTGSERGVQLLVERVRA